MHPIWEWVVDAVAKCEQQLTVAVTSASHPAWLCRSLHSRQFSFGVTDGIDVSAMRPMRRPAHNSKRVQFQLLYVFQ